MATNINNGETGLSARTKINNAFAEINTNVSDIAQIETDLGTVETDLATHIADVANPHAVTKTQVGLSNVDNTSDANKPVSTATQTALDLKQTVYITSTLGLRVETIIASFAVDNGDLNSIQRITTPGSDVTVTLPEPSTLTWPNGGKIIIINEGASGQNVILSPGGSAAIRAYNSLTSTLGPGEAAVIYVGSTTEWLRVS